MPVTADKVVVELSADVGGYLRNMAAAAQANDKTARAAAAAATTVAAAETKKTRATLDALRANQAATAEELAAARATLQKARANESAARSTEANVLATQAAARAEQALIRQLGEELRARQALHDTPASTRPAGVGVVGGAQSGAAFNTSNIAAQFQDIGVTAAAGMHPLIIALQQGTQLSAVLNDSLARGVNPAKALGGAFLQVINPISLATIAAVALGAAGLQALGGLIGGTEDATEATDEHRKAIEKIITGYDEAEAAADDYFDAAGRRPDFAVQRELRDQFQKLAESAASLEPLIGNVLDYVDAAKAAGETTSTTQETVAELARKFRDGEITSEGFYNGLKDVQDGLSATDKLLSNVGAGVGATVARLLDALVVFRQFGDEYARLIALTSIELGTAKHNEELDALLGRKSFIDEQTRLNGLTKEQLSLESEIAAVRSQADRDGVVLTETQITDLAQQRLEAEQRRADIVSNNQDAERRSKETERERQAVTDLVSELEFEHSIVGKSKEDQAVLSELRKAGAAATDVQRAKIEELVRATIQETTELERNKEQMEDIKELAQSVLTGFLNDMREGKTLAEALGGVFDKLADKLIDIAVQNLIASAFGSFGGGGGISLGGGGGVGGAGGIGGGATPRLFASGTANTGGARGQPMGVVHGQEAVIPLPNGGKVPVNVSGASGGDIIFAPTLHMPGADSAAVSRAMAELDRMKSEFVPRVRAEIMTKGRKW